MDLIALADCQDFEEGASKEFVLNQFIPAIELFVVYKNRRFYGYLNSCPHTGATLNWQADQFLDYFHEFILCSIHGALFKIENGYCVRGPCAGMSLQPAPVVVQNGMLYYQNPAI